MEIAVLSLDDIDWHAGDLVIHGKGGQLDRLPLPHDVGETLADYLLATRSIVDPIARYSCGRSRRADRCPPARSAMSSATPVSAPASRRVGSHRLRHTLASERLAAGAPLTEIAP